LEIEPDITLVSISRVLMVLLIVQEDRKQVAVAMQNNWTDLEIGLLFSQPNEVIAVRCLKTLVFNIDITVCPTQLQWDRIDE